MNYFAQMKIKMQEELNIPNIDELFVKEKELEDKEKELNNGKKELENIVNEVENIQKELEDREKELKERVKELEERENKIKESEKCIEPDLPKVMEFNKSKIYFRLFKNKKYFHDDGTEYLVYAKKNVEITNKGKILHQVTVIQYGKEYSFDSYINLNIKINQTIINSITWFTY